MALVKMALAPGGPKDLEVSWKGNYLNVDVSYQGNVVAQCVREDLVQGKDISLPDGSVLRLELKRNLVSGMALDATLNGVPLDDAPGSTHKQLAAIYGFIYFIGGLNVVLGLIAVLGKVEFLLQIGFNLISIILGAVYLLLAFFISKRSFAALLITLILFTANSVFNVFYMISANDNVPMSGIAIRVLIIIYMIQGLKLLRKSKQTRIETP